MPTQTYYELLEMMQAEVHPGRPGRPRHLCPVCRLTLEEVDRFLRLLSLENVNDVDTRRELRQAGGFCNRHAYRWAALHDALGTAIIYEDLLREAGRRIERGDFAPRRSGLFGRTSPPPGILSNPARSAATRSRPRTGLRMTLPMATPARAASARLLPRREWPASACVTSGGSRPG